jgi:hypothetical protein
MTTEREPRDALLVDAATEGLDAAASMELESLLARHPDVDRYAFERAAAAVFLAACGTPTEQMPASLKSKLAMNAEQFVANRHGGSPR